MRSILMRYKDILKVVADSGIWVLMTIPAYFLRLDMEAWSYFSDILILMAVLAPLKILWVYFFNHYKRSWQYSSVSDALNLLKSVGFFTALYFAFGLFYEGFLFIPDSIPLIEGLLTFLFLGGIRFVVRVYLMRDIVRKEKDSPKRVLIAGAGDSGSMIAREMLRHPEANLLPVAFADDAVEKWGKNIMGIPVLGRTSLIGQFAKDHNIDELVIAMPSESGNVIRRIVEIARKQELNHRIIPGLYDLISGKVSINQLRNVDVEDLLRREPVELNKDKIKDYITGRKVMVTGAGGSIGSEIVRQVARFEPECIVLLGRGENSIHSINLEMRRLFPKIKTYIKITDVRALNCLERIFTEIKPDVVFHAAAHKHVYLMEKNPEQAIFNNVGGTKNVADMCIKYGTKYFVNISTDKAVNPTSIMGASKRLAEQVVKQASMKAVSGQILVSVRFGNVLGSRGSVIPLFKEQIKRGGPVTVTDPDMIRYFMTIPEAAQLVMQAGALNKNGSVFVLDMGEPVKILDMAKDLIRLSGLEPIKDISIKFTGKKPGEKLYEELLTNEEGLEVTQHDKIMMANNGTLPTHFESRMENLFEAAEAGDDHTIRAMIKDLLPSYSGLKSIQTNN